MRLSVFSGTLALLLSASSVVSAQAGQKFAFINSQAILQSVPGRAEAEAQFQKEMDVMRAQVAKLGDSLTALQTDYDSVSISLSPVAKTARQKVLRDKGEEYQSRVQKLNDQAEARQGELMAPILETVRKVLDDVRMEGGYSFIFDVAAGSFIVSADKNLDITDKVISKVKLSAPKAVVPKATTGPTAAPAGLKKPPTQ